MLVPFLLPCQKKDLHFPNVCSSLLPRNWRTSLHFFAQILCQIIVSINSLWPHFTGCTRFIISWQFAGWQQGEREWKMQTQNSRSGKRNLTVSQGNLSFCQTSLTAAAELSTVQRKPCPPLQNGWMVKRKRPKTSNLQGRHCHFVAIASVWPHPKKTYRCLLKWQKVKFICWACNKVDQLHLWNAFCILEVVKNCNYCCGLIVKT